MRASHGSTTLDREGGWKLILDYVLPPDCPPDARDSVLQILVREYRTKAKKKKEPHHPKKP